MWPYPWVGVDHNIRTFTTNNTSFKTSPYWSNSALRLQMIEDFVKSSSAIEGINAKFQQKNKNNRKTSRSKSRRN